MFHVGEISLLYMVAGLCTFGKNERMSRECLPEKLLRLCSSPSYSVQWKHLQLVPSLAVLRITEITAK